MTMDHFPQFLRRFSKTKTLVFSVILSTYGHIAAQSPDQNKYSELKKESKAIDSVINIGQTKTAREMALKLKDKSIAQNHAGYYFKSLCQMLYTLDADNDTAHLALLNSEIAGTKGEFKALAYLVYAKWLRRQYTFYIDEEKIYDDNSLTVTDWNPQTLSNKINDYILLSLVNAEGVAYKDEFEVLNIESGTEQKFNFRLSLKAMIANESIDIVSSLSSSETEQEAFDTASLYAERSTFMQIDAVNSKYPDNLKKQIYLYQILAKENQLYLDMERLSGFSGVYPCSAYIKALEILSNDNKENELNIFIVSQIVEYYYSRDKVKALNLVNEGIERYKCSQYLGMLQSQKDRLTERSLRLYTESVYPVKKADRISGRKILLKVEQANSDSLNFYVLKINPVKFINLKAVYQVGEYYGSRTSVHKLLENFPVVYSTSRRFEHTSDLMTHSFDVALPGLEEGTYLIVASDSSMYNHSSLLSMNEITVADFLLEKNNKSKAVKIVSALDGSPLGNEKFTSYTYKDGVLKPEFSSKTNQSGEVFLPNETNYHSRTIELREGNVAFTFSEDYFGNNYYSQDHMGTIILTDRSIYRPGQEVKFKAIVYENKSFKVFKGTEINISFNSNGLEIGNFTAVTNEMGSISGTFKLPETAENDLNIYLVYNEDVISTKTVRVEEYKRPKFEVNLSPPAEAYKLNQQVKVKLEALTYAGVPVSEAKVHYTVRRSSVVYYRYYYENYSSPVQIYSGTGVTGPDGKFDIEFKLTAPLSNQDDIGKSYSYEINAEVTDINGEVISGEIRIVASHSEQFAEITCNKTLYSDMEDITVSYSVNNAAGRKLPFNGTMSVYEWVNGYSLKKNLLWGYSEYSTLSPQDKEDLGEYELEIPKDNLKLIVSKVYQKDTNGVLVFKPENFTRPGKYKVLMKQVAAPGDTVTAETEFEIFPTKHFEENRGQKISLYLINGETFSPGQKVKFVVQTADKNKIVSVHVSSYGGLIIEKNYKLKKGYKVFEIPIREADRGGIHISVYTVDKHRLISAYNYVDVPYSNKELKIKVQTIRRNTEPGSHEKIVLSLSGPASEKAAKELCAVLYDASLDDIYEGSSWNYWIYDGYYSYYYKSVMQEENSGYHFYSSGKAYSWTTVNYPKIGFSYFYDNPDFYWDFGDNNMLLNEGGYGSISKSNRFAEMKADAVTAAFKPEEAPKAVPLKIRSNFNETAFFMPHLMPNDKGEITIEFDLPETIGKWKFMALAHSATMQLGYLEDYILTSKQLMVQPNLPRFIREKDKVVLSGKIQNETDTEQLVTVRIRLSDAATGTALNWMGADSVKTVKIGPKSNVSVAFNLNVPDFNGMISCAFLASSSTHSDGEIQTLPVLSHRTLVRASMPISIRDAGKQNFEFKALLSSASSTLVTHQFSIDMCNRPAWYAVMSLPYLMESDEKSSDQVFSRLYAYSIATYLAQKDKTVSEVYDQWKTKGGMKSKLNINEDLKSVLLSETPWVLEAKSEEERMNRLGELFDADNMDEHIADDFSLLSKLQGNNGGFAWYKGMDENLYITENIVIGFGKLKQMGLDVEPYLNVIQKAVLYMDATMKFDYERYYKRQSFNPSREIAQYLYGKSFFPEFGLNMKDSVMMKLVSASEKNWNQLSLYSKAHLAMAIRRYKPESNVPGLILRAFNENARRDKTLGMYWSNNWTYWQWDQSNIETHTAIMEVYSALSKDSSAMSDLQVWLLSNKQTNAWNSSMSTADACYALLSTGNWLGNNQSVTVTVNGKAVNPTETEAGTGYWRADVPASEVTPQTGKISVDAKTSDLAYGGVYWQYFEEMDKVKSNSAGMYIQRKYFVERIVNGLSVKQEVAAGDTLKVGDIVTVVLFVQVDRAMEYVHIKDLRASAAEVTEALGTYKYQMGLGYYQNPNDVAMNFYIDYLNAGKYQLNYKVSIQQAGVFDCGIASIENMYAPEFSANSVGFKLFVAP